MGARGSFPGVKRPKREADHLPPSSAEVKECVELYFNSPSTPSWRGTQIRKNKGETLLLPSHLNINKMPLWECDFLKRQKHQSRLN